MAQGRLGTALLVANVDSTLYTVPAGKYAIASINLVNRDPSISSKVRIALSGNTTTQTSEYIEFDTTLAAGGTVLERTGLSISPSMNVRVHATTSNVIAVIYGIENNTF
jgi:hypothetical protein